MSLTKSGTTSFLIFSIINGVVNNMVKPPSGTFSGCSLSENDLTIKNTSSGYSMVYTVLEM